MRVALFYKIYVMKKYQFKTNVNCSGCVSKITPYLDANNEIKSWKIETLNPEKILTVETDHLSEGMIETIVKNAGFRAEKINR
jgi:copper chaperone